MIVSNVEEIKGNMITLANEGHFDVIAHGCNCFCTQKSGLAPQMVEAYGTDEFAMEDETFKGDMNKLGQIDFEYREINGHEFFVVNCYTQYGFGRVSASNPIPPIDYEALTLCMRKMNAKFKGMHVGLPRIGSVLAGGDWNKIREIMVNEFTDCKLTLIEYDGS